jgi:hypothetical protein
LKIIPNDIENRKIIIPDSKSGRDLGKVSDLEAMRCIENPRAEKQGETFLSRRIRSVKQKG